MVAIWFALLSCLFRRLRDRHASTYEALGSPILFSNNTPRKNWRFVKFLFSAGSRRLGDDRIASVVVFMRILFAVYTLVFACLVVGILQLRGANLKNLPGWFGVVFAAGVVAMLVWILVMLSLNSEWGQLAVRYRRRVQMTGATWWCESAVMQRGEGSSPPHAASQFEFATNGSWFQHCLIVTANDEGIGFSALLHHRIGRPPLFIPWSDVLLSREQDRKAGWIGRWFLLSERVRLTVPLKPPVSICISTELATKIQERLGRNWFEEATPRGLN
jgi:hypothetical protein